MATVILKKLSSNATPLELLEELDELEELEEDELDELEELDEEVEELDELEELEVLEDEALDDEDAAVPDELDELEELEDELEDELLLELEAGSGLGSDLESLHAEIMARQAAKHAVRLHLIKVERAGLALLWWDRQFIADTPY